MEVKRTMTMTWDGLDDDDDNFFDSNNRISAVVPFDLFPTTAAAAAFNDDSDDDDEFEDPRMSFADGGAARLSNVSVTPMPLPPPSDEGYDVWMAAPTSINERRRRLLQGMGLNSSKELIRLRTMAMSKKVMGVNAPPLPPSAQGGGKSGGGSSGGEVKSGKKIGSNDNDNSDELRKDDGGDVVDGVYDSTGSPSGSPDTPLILVRSRSDGDIGQFSIETKKRKEQLIGNVSKQRLTRTLSTLAPFTRLCKLNYDSLTTTNGGGGGHSVGDNDGNSSKVKNGKRARARARARGNHQKGSSGSTTGEQLGAFFLIKNLDTGKEFIVKEFNEDGMWNKFSDLQTGRQLTMEEFERSVGYSPVVKELMRRENVRLNGDGDSAGGGLERKTSVNAYLSKSFRYSKRRGVSLLKNINRVANSVTGIGAAHEKDHPNAPPVPAPQVIEPPPPPQKGGKGTTNTQNTEWVRVRSQGKVYKELTALRFCQEIQAHEGSIWAMKFSVCGRYLASAGEDKVIHIWEVQECEIASLKPPDDTGNSTPLHPMFCPSPDRDKPPLAPDLSALDKKKKGKFGSRRGGIMPDYVKLPETVFSLSSEPVCSFVGHLDDVLDLSWSSQLHLLSSSMDKTVRLWDLETKACLKLFAHNDYVTCIQFNPVNDDYFISGSLDAKVRVWSVPGRRVVDWTDLHEMVTAACYTPDGQGAAVGSHKGNCRMYSITDGKLNQLSQFDIQNKKKAAPKKITGFQFMPENPNEVLVTSADSRIRIYDGSDVIQKFRGFRNTSSQIAASFSPEGKYVICGSEDSNVYVWKREEPKKGKTKTTIDTKSYEQFQCKDVSLAIPWPGSLKFEPPTIQLHPKKNAKKSTTSTSAVNSPKKHDTNKNSKRHLPPLPNNKVTPTAEKTDNDHNNDDHNNNEVNADGEKAPESPESDPSKITRTESGIDESFNSAAGGSIRYGDSPSLSSNHSPSPSWSSGWSLFDGGGSHGGDTMQARAWGLVIVTAGLGGEIRAYQNFGVPLRVGRQTNLF